MKEPRHDDERLSALLAGRLEGPERDELLAYLSTADEDYEVFANTAAILREMEEEDAQAEEAGVQVADPPPRREVLPPSMTKNARSWRRTPRWAVPAALVGLVVLGLFVLSGRFAPAAEEFDETATRLAVAELPQGWEPPTFGPVVRGPGSNGPDAERNARAAQAGVLLMDLAVAIEAGNGGTTEYLATRLKLYDPRGGSALDSIVALTQAGAPATTLQPHLQTATERLESLTDRDALRLGAWMEAAWLAANGGDAAFFDDHATERMLRRAGKHSRDANGAADQVRTALNADGEGKWPNVQAALTELRNAITR